MCWCALLCVCVCRLVDWWGDTSTDGGFRSDERHGRASSCPLGSASRKALLLLSKLTRAAHRPLQCPLCLLVPFSQALIQRHTLGSADMVFKSLNCTLGTEKSLSFSFHLFLIQTQIFQRIKTNSSPAVGKH